jgi:hypothetical protein
MIALRLKCGDCGNHVPLKLLIDRRAYASNIVYRVSQMLVGENLFHDVAPPVCNVITDMPEKIRIDQGKVEVAPVV